MTYSTGSIILDDDYNIFATGNAAGTGSHSVANVNTVWGTGDSTTDKGYGQSGTIAAVSAGTTITAAQWASLLNRISTLADHQGSTITSITNPIVGDTISAYAALSSNISTVFNNRSNAAANGTDITSGGTQTFSTTWYTSVTATNTVTFSSSNAMRYFFNAGGMIRLSRSRSGGTVNDKNAEWTDLCSQTGTICFTTGASTQTIAGSSYTGTTKVGGAGTPTILTTTTGYYDLVPDAAATTIFQQYADTAPYTTNYIQITAALNAAGTILTFVTTFIDAAADTTVFPDSTPSNLDDVDGTLTSVVLARPPSTTYISNTWGTPTLGGSISGS